MLTSYAINTKSGDYTGRHIGKQTICELLQVHKDRMVEKRKKRERSDLPCIPMLLGLPQKKSAEAAKEINSVPLPKADV